MQDAEFRMQTRMPGSVHVCIVHSALHVGVLINGAAYPLLPSILNEFRKRPLVNAGR